MSPQLRSPCRRSTSTLQHFVTTGVLFIIISLTPSTKAGFTRDCQYIDVSSYNTANLCDGGLDVNVRNRCNAYNEMSLTVCDSNKKRAIDELKMSKKDAYAFLRKRELDESRFNILCECCVYTCSFCESIEFCQNLERLDAYLSGKK